MTAQEFKEEKANELYSKGSVEVAHAVEHLVPNTILEQYARIKFEETKEKWLQEIFTRYPDSKEQSSRVIIQVGKREIIIPIPLI